MQTLKQNIFPINRDYRSESFLEQSARYVEIFGYRKEKQFLGY